MDMPLVSIVIPVYNRFREVERAINSITTQSYRNIEVVVVDDASTDGTDSVVRDLAMRDPRVRLLRAPSNGGSQRAANLGIRAARGDWIGFLDSDDWYLEGSVAARMQQLLREGADCVHSDGVLREQSGHERVLNLPALSGRVYREVLTRPGPMFQSLLTRKSALDRAGLRDEAIVAYQEWDLAIGLARFCTFAFVRQPTYVYDCTTPVTISKSRRNDAIGYEQVVLKHRGEILSEAGPEALYAHYREAMMRHRVDGGVRAIWRCCRRWTVATDCTRGMALRVVRHTLVHSVREFIRCRMPARLREGMRKSLAKRAAVRWLCD